MRFNAGAFNAFLGNIGQEYEWRKSFACPCVNLHSGAARPNCPQCGGRGRLWAAGVHGVAGVASSRIQREWAQFGVYENGDTVVSIPENTPMYDIGPFDRVRMLNSTEQFSLPLVRGQNDRLLGPIESIERVFWLHPQTRAIVEGGIPTVAADGTLTWTADEPPAGMQYSISGRRLQEFFCWGDFPSNRNQHQGMRLPRRVVLRKFDLFGRATPASA